MSHVALLAFGANLGDPAETLVRVAEKLQVASEISDVCVSQAIANPAIGGPDDQPDFLNAAIRLETKLEASDLIQFLLKVEVELGRQRSERWDARTVDLDLLLFDQLVVDSECCTVPHPRLSFRRFMLEPAVQIAADWRHPLCGMTLAELLNQIDLANPVIASTVDLPVQIQEDLQSAGYGLQRMAASELAEVAKLSHQRRPKFFLLASKGSPETGQLLIPGPFLDLGSLEPATWQREILAAVQAMAPI